MTEESPERKPLPKTLRFEVFKRDSFTCQYCGAKSPDVVLHVDHITAVASGGQNDIMNLITSCVSCNAGKGARALDDYSILQKQRAQLDELNERREQLEMMIQWREGLNDLVADAVDAIDGRVLDLSGFGLSESGKQKARKLVREYGLSDILDAIETSYDQYITRTPDGKATNESANVAFNKIPSIIKLKKVMVDKPYMRDLFYIRGIIRNRTGIRLADYKSCLELLERAHIAGASIDSLREFSKGVNNWSDFQDEITAFLEENEK